MLLRTSSHTFRQQKLLNSNKDEKERHKKNTESCKTQQPKLRDREFWKNIVLLTHRKKQKNIYKEKETQKQKLIKTAKNKIKI